jgi:redox-sensitive bicupin YhaK (pirin superfamily)
VLPTLGLGDATATVVLGELAGVHSPATTYSPIVGAQIVVPAGGGANVPLQASWEHGVVVLDGELSIDGGRAPGRDSLVYLPPGRNSVELSSPHGATAFLLGGEPFPDPLVMWWNFVGRTHQDIADAREAWEARDARFGRVPGHGDVRIPAPPLPSVTLLPRTRQVP